MDEDDNKIREFISNDKMISEKVNKTFDSFIEKVQNDKVYQDDIQNNKVTKLSYFIKFKKILTVAASLVIVMFASNVYAKTQGYDNIFFLIKDIVIKQDKTDENVFSDRDIVISYKPIQITEEIELQINELQIKDHKAKLYLLVKELKENEETPFKYKVYNNEKQEMFNSTSNKKQNERVYNEVLTLQNYTDTCDEINMEIYNKNQILLKTIKIDLINKTLEARTENQGVKKISQIELNKFLKKETETLYTKQELKNNQIIIIDIYDIFYSNGKYITKYLYMMPNDEEFEKGTVEETTIYTNTIEFILNKDNFIKTKIEKPDIFE